MLKIKDDVDLKCLENFGFMYEENKKLSYNSVYVWRDLIKINGSSQSQIYIRRFNDRNIYLVNCGIALDKLFELIQAGLVEKV